MKIIMVIVMSMMMMIMAMIMIIVMMRAMMAMIMMMVWRQNQIGFDQNENSRPCLQYAQPLKSITYSNTTRNLLMYNIAIQHNQQEYYSNTTRNQLLLSIAIPHTQVFYYNHNTQQTIEEYFCNTQSKFVKY